MAQYKVNSKCHLPAGWIGCVCGGGGDGGGGEGGLGRKASRQLISAPLSSLKGSGLLCRGALHPQRAALGCHGDTVSSGHPAKWHWCHGSAASCSAPYHSVATEPLPSGSPQGWKEQGKPKSVCPTPRHAWWAGKAAWTACLQEGLIEASFLR